MRTGPDVDRRELLRAALRKVEQAQSRVEALEGARTEPVAVIGLGCRFPGAADDPESFWALLHDGTYAVTEAPSDRWGTDECSRLDPGFAAKGHAIHGAFLRDIDRFDPAFFGISPREAVSMDPQQRLVLEVSWEALEHAGIAPDRLRGSLTGVFVGITVFDYAQRLDHADSSRLELYFATGNAHNAAPGRVSYVLGLQGPSLAVDTACSSSLTAVHLACQSLRLRESDLALAGGVNALLLPDVFLSFARGGLIAPDGRCKAFDAGADGFVRSEGCGMVVLKRLSDALAAGDPVLALILGSALNQDGASGGLTVPNGLAQQAVIGQALRVAGVAPAEVGYVEAHGTGTALGDPLELEALDAVLGEGRPADRPLLVGSLKTNLGHAEAAAGVAGLIKVVLALQNQQIPPHLHFRRLNPNVALRNAGVRVPTTLTPWPSGQARRVAGVSSFGFSGTNAHVVLAEAPARPTPEQAADRPVHLLVLSAKSEAARAQLALRYARHFERHPELDFGDVCFTAAAGRARLPFRLALVAASLDEARDKLMAAADADEPAGVLRVRARADRPRLAFLFTGQGAQYAGMGRQLYESEPVFRKALERCDDLLRPHLAPSLLSLLYSAEAGPSRLSQTAYAQPALFALEYALAELWRSWGIEPAVVMGHSVGEYVAACVAGVFSLEEGLAFVAARGRLMQALPPGGEMAAVAASEERVAAAVARHPGAAAIAAFNGPASFVVSGAAQAVGAIVAELEREGTDARRLAVSHAFHSPLMDPVLDELERMAAGVTLSPPRIPLVSNLTGRLATHEVASPRYWRRHAREPVRFSRGMETLREEQCSLFIEIGPHPTLLGMGRSCLPDGFGTWLPSLRKDRDDWRELLSAVGTLYVHGVEVDARALDRDRPRRRVALPTYPFERSRYWVEDVRRGAPAADLDSWLYEMAWAPRGQSAPAARSPRSDRWLVFADARGVGSRLARLVAEDGASCTVILPGEDYAVDAEGVIRVNPARPDHMHRLWREALLPGHPTPVRVVHLWSLDAPAQAALSDLDAARVAVCGSVLNLVHSVLAYEGASPTRIHLVTCGAEAVLPGEAPALAQAPLWGLGRGIAVEHPEIWGGLVDLDPTAPGGEALLAELDAPNGEDQVALRGGNRHVARLVRKTLPAGRPRPAAVDGTCLVTGGLGSLGLRVARWLCERGTRHLALVGRRPPSAAQAEEIRSLTREGASVRTFTADVADPACMAAVLAELQAGSPPLRGVVHAAGVISLQTVSELSEAALAEVFRPKVAGAWVLHELTRELELDFFVAFSSAASVWGSRLLAHYAAANHFLDALARHRRGLGLPALTVNWGPWSEGMASSEGQRELAQMGVGALSPNDGLKALDRLLAAGVEEATVARVDWDVFAPIYSAKVRRPLLERLESSTRAQDARPDAGDLARELAGALPADRRSVLSLHVQAEASRVLGGEGSVALEPGRGFKELGMDSLMAVELRNRLQHRLGRPLPSTLAFDYPTIDALVGFLLQQVPGLSDVAVSPTSRDADELAALEMLSEAEVKELIAEELQSLSSRVPMEGA